MHDFLTEIRFWSLLPCTNPGRLRSIPNLKSGSTPRRQLNIRFGSSNWPHLSHPEMETLQVCEPHRIMQTHVTWYIPWIRWRIQVTLDYRSSSLCAHKLRKIPKVMPWVSETAAASALVGILSMWLSASDILQHSWQLIWYSSHWPGVAIQCTGRTKLLVTYQPLLFPPNYWLKIATF